MFYKLIGKEPVKCNYLEWEEWIQNAERTVAIDLINSPQGVVTVATEFSGVSCETSTSGAPLRVFETQVFGGAMNPFTQYYSTWEEAETGHKNLVATLRNKLESLENP